MWDAIRENAGKWVRIADLETVVGPQARKEVRSLERLGVVRVRGPDRREVKLVEKVFDLASGLSLKEKGDLLDAGAELHSAGLWVLGTQARVQTLQFVNGVWSLRAWVWVGTDDEAPSGPRRGRWIEKQHIEYRLPGDAVQRFLVEPSWW